MNEDWSTDDLRVIAESTLMQHLKGFGDFALRCLGRTELSVGSALGFAVTGARVRQECVVVLSRTKERWDIVVYDDMDWATVRDPPRQKLADPIKNTNLSIASSREGRVLVRRLNLLRKALNGRTLEAAFDEFDETCLAECFGPIDDEGSIQTYHIDRELRLGPLIAACLNKCELRELCAVREIGEDEDIYAQTYFFKSLIKGTDHTSSREVLLELAFSVESDNLIIIYLYTSENEVGVLNDIGWSRNPAGGLVPLGGLSSTPD